MAQRTVRIENGVTTQLSNTHIEQLSLSRFTVERGAKRYELTNHLGNVLTVVTDKKLPVCSGTSVSYFIADVVSATDYSPFGAPLEGRTWQGSEYRYDFYGKEKDDEVKGEGNFQDYGFRVYNCRLGRFLSIDPLTSKYPMLTPFQFAENMTIWAVDLDGLEAAKATTKYVVRVFESTNIPSATGKNVKFAYGNGQPVYASSEEVIEEGEEGGDVWVRYTDVVPGSHVTIYWVIYKTPRIQIIESKRVAEIYVTAEIPKIPKPPVDLKLKQKPHLPAPSLNIKFEGNSDRIKNKKNALNNLKDLAEYLIANPNSKITLIGNTGTSDPNGLTGSSPEVLNSAAELNGRSTTQAELMLARANSVKKMLVSEFGIDASRIAVKTGTRGRSESSRKVTVKISN